MREPIILTSAVHNLFEQYLELTERLKWAGRWKDDNKVLAICLKRNEISDQLKNLDQKIHAYIKRHA